MPRFLSSLNLNDVSSILRELHMNNIEINKLYSYGELLTTLSKNIQRSCYENFIIKLATAYDGYKFYLPAFLDFRGRIYRCGMLHFHERDLARSLILIAGDGKEIRFHPDYMNHYIVQTAFHYKAFTTTDEAFEWFNTNADIDKDFLGLARGAKRPFQFLANLIGLAGGKEDVIINTAITQDASASAYQIMSYLLLDESMAMRTNLIPSSDYKIKDIYTFFLEELKEFLQEEGDNKEIDINLSRIVCGLLTRKIVKGIFMPIIYGKTQKSTADDLRELLSHYLTFSDCHIVASACFKFWQKKYHGMNCLIRLIRSIGWIVSSRDCPVYYKVAYFSTVQDYMKMLDIKIRIFDKRMRKWRRVTLSVPSSERDRRKTLTSTFVNFIHQKDANIAMSVVETMLSVGAPIYTVHDNFITTVRYCDYVPTVYSSALRDLGPPLKIINEFIYMNVIKHIAKRDLGSATEDYFLHRKIPEDMLRYYLNSNIPIKCKKSDHKLWEIQIAEILSSYNEYSNIICGKHSHNSKDSWIAHEDKWKRFINMMIRRDGYPNYCVHY